jgi:putative FmdB family regulatory protein
MPIYEYECGACGDRHEFIQKFGDGPKRKCPACGARKLKRLVSAAAFHLKGNGWYVTDFRDKDKKKGDGKSAADAKDGGKDGGKDGKSSTGAKDGGKDGAAKSPDKSAKSSDTGKSAGDGKSPG